MGLWKSIKDQVDELDQRRQDWVESQIDFDEERVQLVIDNAAGNSVNRDTLLIPVGAGIAPINLLDEGEQPHYFLNGSTVDVEGQGSGGESIVGWDRDRRIGSAYTVITEQRVLIIANHARGYDEHTVPYDSITAVNLNSGIASTRLSIQTKSATYHCSVSKSKRKYGSSEVDSAAKFLRKYRQQNHQDDSTDDPLDRLEKLKDLYDNGAITEDEFEEKKSSLLDEI